MASPRVAVCGFARDAGSRAGRDAIIDVGNPYAIMCA